MRYLYNLVWFLILPFLPIRLLWRSRKNSAYRKNILERFAYFSFPALKGAIWVHTVSVGEALSAAPLVKALIKHYPDTKIVVTTMTPTGRERLQKIFTDNEILLLYVPYDYPLAVKRFLHHLNPKILVLIETEIWPNILYYTAKLNTPIIIGNARLSAKSFAGYSKIRPFIKSIINYTTMILAQSKLDAERFQTLGLEPQKISIAGNIKFDISIPNEVLLESSNLHSTLGKARPIWVAASTHPLEEEKVLVATKKVLESIPNALLILVPRHPERFDTVFDLCNQRGFKTIRYTKLQDYSSSINIIVGDVMGKMLSFYAASDIAFVGGSLIPWGGHNLLEPAALAKPILTGPNLNAFLEISQLLADADAMIKVNNEEELAQNLLKLFANSELRGKLGTAALDVVEKHRGATTKILTTIENIIK